MLVSRTKTSSEHFVKMDEHCVIWQVTLLGNSAQLNAIHSGKHSHTHTYILEPKYLKCFIAATSAMTAGIVYRAWCRESCSEQKSRWPGRAENVLDRGLLWKLNRSNSNVWHGGWLGESWCICWWQMANSGSQQDQPVHVRSRRVSQSQKPKAVSH